MSWLDDEAPFILRLRITPRPHAQAPAAGSLNLSAAGGWRAERRPAHRPGYWGKNNYKKHKKEMQKHETY